MAVGARTRAGRDTPKSAHHSDRRNLHQPATGWSLRRSQSCAQLWQSAVLPARAQLKSSNPLISLPLPSPRRSPFSTLPAEIVYYILRLARTDPDLTLTPAGPSSFLALSRVCKPWRAPVAELAGLDLDLTALGAPERWLEGPLARYRAGGGRQVPMRSLRLAMEADEGVLRLVLDGSHGLRRLEFAKRDSASIGLSYKILDHPALKGK